MRKLVFIEADDVIMMSQFDWLKLEQDSSKRNARNPRYPFCEYLLVCTL